MTHTCYCGRVTSKQNGRSLFICNSIDVLHEGAAQTPSLALKPGAYNVQVYVGYEFLHLLQLSQLP